MGQKERQEELENCKFVKTILMTLVVFYHSIVFWRGNWFTANPAQSAEALGHIANWLNTFMMQGFVMISGYIFYFIKYERGRYGDFSKFVVSKAKRLLVPYVFAALVWVIPAYCVFFSRDLEQIAGRFFLATSPNQLWFLVMLFDVFLIFWLLSDYCRSYEHVGMCVMLCMYGLSIVGPRIFPNIMQIWSALSYIPLFWLGFKLRQHGSRLIRKIPAAVWVVAELILFIIVESVSGFDSIIMKLAKIWFELILNITGGLMAFVVLQKIAERTSWKTSNWFSRLTKHTMPVYLIHQQIIYVFIVLLNGLLNPYLHATVNFIGAMTVSLAISTILLKFKTTRFLVGEK